jgi:hypothetical protein
MDKFPFVGIKISINPRIVPEKQELLIGLQVELGAESDL